MEKMGWKEGEGLGKDGSGMLNPVGIKYKMDNLGFGCTQKYDKQWVAHQDSFNDLLAGLSAETTTETATESKPVLADQADISSLGQTGKKSGHRYHKFTKAKDLSKASAKDMEGIFGRSSVSEAKAAEAEVNRIKAEEEEEEKKPKFEESTKHVKQTENVHEYFKRKMAERMARLSGVKTEPMEEQLMIKSEPVNDEEEEPVKKKKKSKKTKIEPKEEVEVKTEPVEEMEEEVAQEEVEVKKKKKKKRK